MTATDRLRELLDERGVDYRVSATGYSIDIGPYTTAYANRSDTTLDVSLRQVTPEQAIVATLGSGTCHMEPVKNYQVSEYATSWGCVCSNCGTFHEFTHGKGWKYCPICRAEVVDA